MQQQLNGLNLDEMLRESFVLGTPLARVADFMPFYRDVNLALDGEGVLYDASGKLIEGKRLAGVGQVVNRAQIYLNDSYKKSKPGNSGFSGLDVVHVTGFDGEKPILERHPLETYVVDCWADLNGGINHQGYFTQKA